jgi:hypothetical protein
MWGVNKMRRQFFNASLPIFLVIVICLSPLISAAPPGDANNDGKIDSLDIQAIIDHILGRTTATGNGDGNQDAIINIADLLTVIKIISEKTPTPTPTPVTINIKDYFILSQNSWWHFAGFEGGSPDDNFKWTVLSDTITVGGTKSAVKIKTETDEPTDERNNDVDFWVLEPNGDLYFWGYHEGGIGDAAFPEQDVILTDPILFGKDGMTIGTVISDTGSGKMKIVVFGFTQTVTIGIQSAVTYTSILPQRSTPIGTFTDVLRVSVDITLETPIGDYPFRASTFFLKKGKGMVVQDQKPDVNDAELQGIDDGQVSGVKIQPDIAP